MRPEDVLLHSKILQLLAGMEIRDAMLVLYGTIFTIFNAQPREELETSLRAINICHEKMIEALKAPKGET